MGTTPPSPRPSALDAWPDPLLVLEAGRFVEANRAATELLGLPDATGVLGRTLAEVSPAAQPDRTGSEAAATALLAALAPGAPLRREWVLRDATGAEVWVELTLSRVDATRVNVAWHDITARRREAATLAESESWFRSFFTDNSSVMLLVDPFDGTIVDANHAAHRFYRYGEGGLVSRPITLINTSPPEAVAAQRLQALRRERSHFLFQHRLADGELRDVEVYSTPFQRNGRALLHSIIHDVTQRARAEERLRLTAAVFSNAREGIVITDHAARIVEVNDAFLRITQYAREEVLGKNPNILRSGRQDTAFYQRMWAELADHGRWYGEVWNRRKNGEIYAELLDISAVTGDAGTVTHYVGIFSDITEIKLHELQLRELAHHDALTGLPNRLLLGERLRQAMAQSRRNHRPLAVVYLDMDGFKAVNDRHGHAAGDSLLRAVAERMRGALREVDTIGRIGGDEFVIILPDLLDADATLPVLDRLLATIRRPILLGGEAVEVGASLGVTYYPQHEEIDADQLLRQADLAMYQAKVQGKGRHHTFDPDQDRELRGKHESSANVVRALETGELVVHYQPQVNLRTGGVSGVEALIRWQHPERGLLLPADFLRAIEDDPAATRLTDWVVTRALVDATAWAAAGLDLSVSVNIGARDVQDRNFPRRLAAIFAQNPAAAPERLKLELLETSAIEDLPRAVAVMRAVKDLGVGFAIDDFGTGYAALNYLRWLPADALKLDRSFVGDMLDDPEDLRLVEGILGMARAFRLDVVAEGLETEAQGAMLLRLGCELAQGFGVARPMPAEAVLGWARGWAPARAWATCRPVPEDAVPLLHATVEYRALVRAAELWVAERSPTRPRLRASALGSWLRGPASGELTDRPELAALLAAHEAFRADLEALPAEPRGGADAPARLTALAARAGELERLLLVLADGHLG